MGPIIRSLRHCCSLKGSGATETPEEHKKRQSARRRITPRKVCTGPIRTARDSHLITPCRCACCCTYEHLENTERHDTPPCQDPTNHPPHPAEAPPVKITATHDASLAALTNTRLHWYCQATGMPVGERPQGKPSAQRRQPMYINNRPRCWPRRPDRESTDYKYAVPAIKPHAAQWRLRFFFVCRQFSFLAQPAEMFTLNSLLDKTWSRDLFPELSLLPPTRYPLSFFITHTVQQCLCSSMFNYICQLRL